MILAVIVMNTYIFTIQQRGHYGVNKYQKIYYLHVQESIREDAIARFSQAFGIE